jgi:hypothetical protein
MRICFWFALMLVWLSAVGTALAQDTHFATGPQYLMNYGSPLFAQPISTPSISLAGPPVEVGARNATGVLIAGAENQTVLPPLAVALPKIDLFPIFYGDAPVSVIEISFAKEPSRRELPASILDAGVWQITTAEALRELGYGVTLPEAVAYGKARLRRATRVYTNADIDRLHSGS